MNAATPSAAAAQQGKAAGAKMRTPMSLGKKLAIAGAAGLVVIAAVAALGGLPSSSVPAYHESPGESAESASSSTSASSSGGGGLSDAPEFNEKFQAREPRTCPTVRHKPSISEAIALIECVQDSKTVSYLTLWNDFQIEMAPSRPYLYQLDAGHAGIDVNASVYPLSGTANVYTCTDVSDYLHNEGKNCSMEHAQNAVGSCVKTTSGDWKCNLVSTNLTDQIATAGPRTF